MSIPIQVLQLAGQSCANANRQQRAAMAASFAEVLALQGLLHARTAQRYHTDVLESNGHHIPSPVRRNATALFWLPIHLYSNDILGVSPDDLPVFFLTALAGVRAYVAGRIPFYDWASVSDYNLLCQYWNLLRAWQHAVRGQKSDSLLAKARCGKGSFLITVLIPIRERR